MEVFEDFTVDKTDYKAYTMIAKREFNPELSAFSNLLLDLVDFKDRVRPMAKDITLLDVANKYQPRPVKLVDEENEAFEAFRKEMGYDDAPKQEFNKELSEKSGAEDAAVPDYHNKNKF